MTALAIQLFEIILARPWETTAVLLGIAYVVFAARESVLCWPAALISTAIFICLFWDVSLLMESPLNIYYLIMALYGWWQWTKGAEDHSPRTIHSWPLKYHLINLALILCLSLVSGYLLSRHTQAALPFLDSVTTWGALVATFMVTRKVLENWLYWIVLDAISVYLYLDRAMFLTAMLMFSYVFIAAYGWYSWKKALHA